MKVDVYKVLAALVAAVLTVGAAAVVSESTSEVVEDARSVLPPGAIVENDRRPGPLRSAIAYGPGGLPAEAGRRLVAHPDVERVALVRRQTVGLTAVRQADGELVTSVESGYRIPLDAAAVDPASYTEVLDPGPDRDAVRALVPGAVLLTRSSAELRGVGSGATIDLLGLPGLTVADVVSDDAIPNSEIVLTTDDADRLGLKQTGSFVIRHRGGSSTDFLDSVVGKLESLGPVRVARTGTATAPAPVVLPTVEVKQRFGEFAYKPRQDQRPVDLAWGFESTNVVRTQIPVLGTVRCHRLIIDDLRAAFEEIVAAGLAHHIQQYDGCFYARRVSTDTDTLSRHSWGIAFDINVDLEHPQLGPPPDPEIIEIFARHGFRWGGTFVQPDNHHFEWVGDAATAPLPTSVTGAMPTE